MRRHLLVQQFFSGVALLSLYTCANALFLPAFGGDAVAYTFVVIGFAGAAMTLGFRTLQKRWSFGYLGAVSYGVFASMIIFCRIMLNSSSQRWIVFTLMVLYTLMLSNLTVIVGLQSARLFEGRLFRKSYPLVILSQILGAISTGLLMTPLLRWIGAAENLLWVAGGALGISLLSFLLHVWQFPSYYRKARPTPLQRTLIQDPYVRRIFSYQFSSYLGTRLVTFLGLLVVAERFSDSDTIARFFGNLAAVLTLLTALFLGIAAGYVMSRFGLRVGLSANPVMVLVGILLALTAALAGSEDGFFWMVILAYGMDFIFTSGTTDTAIRTVYKSLPELLRDDVETIVMGLIYPASYTAAGMLIILIQLLPEVSSRHVLFIALVLTLLWVYLARVVYVSYVEALKADSEIMLKLATLEMMKVRMDDLP